MLKGLTLGICAAVGIGLVLGSVPSPQAALPPIDPVASDEVRYASSPLVRRAQQALSRLGLYLGVEDGRLGPDTRAAIRIFQRLKGLEIDTQVTSDLVGKLEYAVGVRRLLQRLEKARARNISDARSKLLSHPATRDLVSPQDTGERSDPTRNASACFDDPTVLCLLDEARDKAKAVAKAELRDWALGEILIAEARAGLGARAMETASQIGDPRLVIVALRDIAEAQAATGQADAALAAAEIIPDIEKQADAFAEIAHIQLRRGEHDNAIKTSRRLLNTLDGIEDDLKRLANRSRAAVILARAGLMELAGEHLLVAEVTARALSRSSSRSAGLRHVATALADINETTRALELLESVTSPSDRVPVLMSAAEAQAQAGDAAVALATASSIESVRYRAVLLGRIAQAQAYAGELTDADTTLEVAMAAIDRIERPYARSFAISRIARTMADIHGTRPDDSNEMAPRYEAMARAVVAAKGIDDQRLKAQTLWQIAVRQRDIGDPDWPATEAAAWTATDSIAGDLSRVWMFASLAEEHAAHQQRDAAWRSFSHGVQIASGIENAWSRSRTMAKLAATLIRLVDPGVGRIPDDP